MRLVPACGNLYQSRPFGELCDQRQLCRMRQQGKIGGGKCGVVHRNPGLARLAQERQAVGEMLGLAMIGGPQKIRAKLEVLLEQTGADELIFGKDVLTQKTFEGDRYLYRRTLLWAPAQAQLTPFVGRYRSDEIGVTYRVSRGASGLVLKLEERPTVVVPMNPVYRDAFARRGLGEHRRQPAADHRTPHPARARISNDAAGDAGA